MSVSFTSLAKEIFEKFGSRSGEYAEDIHKFILMNKAIKELEVNKSLQYFNKQSRKINFIGDALKIVTEFRQCGILSEEFMRFVDSADNKYNEKFTIWLLFIILMIICLKKIILRIVLQIFLKRPL